MNHEYDYDLVAIGAGSGGLSVVERAAAYGQKCAVIERGKMGGTCVNVGCVPKKIMWFGANLADMIKESSAYGFDLELKGFDWRQLILRREQYISGINSWYHGYLKDLGIDEFTGNARFIDPHSIAVGDQIISAKHITISTGTTPYLSNIPGSEHAITSDGFFELQDQPKQVVIVGSGYIAVELAGVLNALGTKVTMYLRKEHVLGDFDGMIQSILFEQLESSGVELRTNIEVTSIQKEQDNQLSIEDTQDLGMKDLDAVMYAIGRVPDHQDLDIETSGVELDNRGYIKCDLKQNTTQPHIFALGDITGRAPLTPVAIAAGRRLADRLYDNQVDRHLDYENISTVVFSHPPVGTIGLTEREAREKHGEDIKVYQTRFTAMYNSIADHDVPTAMKLICLGDDQKIIGCHLIGPAVDEMMQGFAVAIRMGACKRDFDDTIAIHPTSAEELVTMR
ncbi:MAG: glutathione reductase (NADPH) [Gammaproteobacteria bacterium]|jgi:glutathione reductase (NADPH)